jgi:hypothetical protein
MLPPPSKAVAALASAWLWLAVDGHDHHTAAPPLMVHYTASAPAVPGFGPPHVGQRIVGASLEPPTPAPSTVEQCGASCQAAPECNGFNWADAGAAAGGVSNTNTDQPSCELCTWGPNYVVMQNSSWMYYSRVPDRNDTAWTAAVPYLLDVPLRGVQLTDPDSPFSRAFDTNLEYLSQYPVDDLLHNFRIRAGVPNPPGKTWGWDNGGVDAPYVVAGLP